MKIWKIWAIGIVVVVLAAVVAIGAAVWNNISSEWQAETQTAQFALDNSSLEHIDNHQVFTAAGLQEVYFGTDAFHNKVVAFVYGSPLEVYTVPQTELVTESSIQTEAEKSGVKIKSIALGYLSPDSEQMLGINNTNVIYEVYGTGPNQHDVYDYFDAMSGKLVKQIPNSTTSGAY